MHQHWQIDSTLCLIFLTELPYYIYLSTDIYRGIYRGNISPYLTLTSSVRMWVSVGERRSKRAVVNSTCWCSASCLSPLTALFSPLLTLLNVLFHFSLFNPEICSSRLCSFLIYGLLKQSTSRKDCRRYNQYTPKFLLSSHCPFLCISVSLWY